MQGGRGGGNPFFGFGDPFGSFGGFGGFGGQRGSPFGFLDGRDPFDDPFFTRPFGGMFESNTFGPIANPFVPMQPQMHIEHQAPGANRPRGPVIEELDSDDETQDPDVASQANSRKHGRSGNEPYIEEVDDEAEGRQSKQLVSENMHNRFSRVQNQPHSQSFVVQSSTVSYGGSNGTYYTSSKTRRTGSDGVTYEESKEADTSTKKASHRISRGIHDKGHTLDRKLNPDGRVETQEILHNLEQDELLRFEQSWKNNDTQTLPQWAQWGGNSSGFNSTGNRGSAQNHPHASHGRRALPSTELSNPIERSVVASSGRQHSGKAKQASGSQGR
ncbi:hypothetical protein LINGRAHAP2_LOCUS3437 [Linum grandiflorum]